MHHLERWFLSVGDLPFTWRFIGGDICIVIFRSDLNNLNTSTFLNISADLLSYISYLLLMLGANPKIPRGSERGVLLVHGYDIDLNFYAKIYSIFDM